MALKRCPECKKKISDTSDRCIHCGYKLKNSVGEYDDYYYEYPDTEEAFKESPLRGVFKIIGIIFGSILAVAAVALLIYTFINSELLGFTKGAVMEAVSIIALIGGVTTAVLCDRLL